MSESLVFNGFSFFSGVFTGFILRWTDIIPIIGGFMLGLTVRKIPDFINLNDLPPIIKNYLHFFAGNELNSNESSLKKSRKKK